MALVHSILIGVVGGMRAMTPLAAVANAARTGLLPRGNGAPRWLSLGVVSAAADALAAGEMAGDKMKSAPDRIVAAGLLARCATGAIAGAALAPASRRRAGALLGAASAVAASYVTFHLRMAALRRYGQTPTGLVEDAITAAAATIVVTAAAPTHRRR